MVGSALGFGGIASASFELVGAVVCTAAIRFMIRNIGEIDPKNLVKVF